MKSLQDMENNILVLSFEAFSKESSNGKTIWSLVESLSCDNRISQIYIKGGEPNVKGNCRYFFIDEKKLVNPFLKPAKIAKEIKEVRSHSIGGDLNKKHIIKKTPFTMILRDFLWRINFSKLKKLIFDWIEEQKPKYFIYFDNDLPFLSFLACQIKKRFGCKMIYFTSENYPLKVRNYMNKRYKNSVIYSLFRKKLFICHSNLFKFTDCEIFLTDSLMKEYSSFFKLSSPHVIYPSSSCKKLPRKTKQEIFTFSYCGNLNNGRWETLLLFLDAIERHKNIKIIVASNLEKEKAEYLKKLSNVEFYGFVEYEEVISIYKKSDVLLHFESFDSLISKDNIHAFTGKVADCISCQKPFMYYGPLGNALSYFLSQNKCGFQAHSKQDLLYLIENFMIDSSFLFSLQDNSEKASNHFFNKAANNILIRELVLK